MRGKVTMEDGSPPPGRVVIQRVCPGAGPLTEGITDKRGYYLWSVLENLDVVCVLRASLAGYESNTIDTSVESLYFSTDLPTLILHPRSSVTETASPRLPRAAAKPWELGMKAMAAKRWPEAEDLLRKTVRAAPHFASGWNALGAACQNGKKTDDAREAYRHAIEEDPGMLAARLNLTRLEISAQNWPAALKAAEGLVKADQGHQFPEAYLDELIARYALHDWEGAESVATTALRLDTKHEQPRLEYFLGAVLGQKGDREGGAEHLRRYLALAPNSEDAPGVRAYLDDVEKAKTEPLPLPAQDQLLPPVGDSNLPAVGDAWAPGGLKDLAAMAHVKGALSEGTFFLEYCRAIAFETSKANSARTPGYAANLDAYMTAIAELTRLGETRGDETVVTVSLADAAGIAKARQILPLLGWTVVDDGGAPRVAPGDRSADGPRQSIPPALGIDELAMQRELDSGRSFRFAIPTQTAKLTGGVAWWGSMVQGFASLPGGVAGAFARDPRLARTYAALAAMPPDTAKAVVSQVGLRALTELYSDALWQFSDSFRIVKGSAAVPGGSDAEKVWAKLAGANPRNPAEFFRALLAADRGRVAAFYWALAHADSGRQRFFLKSTARAQKFYAWYRESKELRDRIGQPAQSWRTGFLQNLPVEADGRVRFPGGKAPWAANGSASDEDALLHLRRPEALPAIAQLEERRGGRFDDASVRLLLRHFDEWRPLFPYFEVLPGLGRAELEALETFSATVAGYRKPEQNLVTGEWHSLMALIVLGRKAGTVDAATGARAFLDTCRGLLADNYSSKAMDVLHEIAGGTADLDEAVPEKLLRLGGPQRAAFDRVRQLQGAPRLDTLGAAPGAERTLAALAGLVYGALANPDSLLISEDPALLHKHQFVPDTCAVCAASSPERTRLFSDARLLPSVGGAGARIIGGFIHFDGVAHGLLPGGGVRVSAPRLPGGSRDLPETTAAGETLFRTTTRLVEVFATVSDSRGRYVDGLTRSQFTILDNGKATPIAAFGSEASDVSWALLLDTTESMQASLPALKRAALELIARLRARDSVAVYALSGGIAELQAFTADKDAAARAVLRTQPGGLTALYDGLVRVVRDIGGRPGKKAILVLTDGGDNISTLPAETAIQRAKSAGVPIYTIARGTDLHEPALEELAGISRSTGGLPFTLHASSEIPGLFDRVFEDLMHGYVLAFRPAEAEGGAWRSIDVLLKDPRGRKVHARDGYYPE